MKRSKVYIVKNTIEGYKVVKDGKHVDCTKPMFIGKDEDEAKLYCENNKLEVIRLCK